MVVNNVKVYGLEESIKRAKYPMSTDVDKLNFELTKGIKNLGNSERGSGHDQFLTGIIVQFDLTFTVKAWTEAERYSFLDFISSQSTMHRITKFGLQNFNVSKVFSRRTAAVVADTPQDTDNVFFLRCRTVSDGFRRMTERRIIAVI